jgi:mono/diheme cytochrome c family protein
VGIAAGTRSATRCIDSASVRRLVLVLAALAVLAPGCSLTKPGGKVVSPTPETVVGTVAKQPELKVPPQYANGDPVAGKAVFTGKAGCIGCHTLKAANSHGTVGPNLDDAKPDLAKIVDRVTNGKGAMPPFKGVLSDKEIADVAAFVYQSTHTQ